MFKFLIQFNENEDEIPTKINTPAELITSHLCTAISTIPINTSTGESSNPSELVIIPFNQFAPNLTHIVDKEEVAPIAMLNEAYSALNPDDRGEMDIWDCTLKDGLEDE